MRNEYEAPLDGHQLAAFAAVIELGSLDAAAERLHVTPSAVSQRIKALEQRVGQVLVVREKPCTATQASCASSAAMAEWFGVPASLPPWTASTPQLHSHWSRNGESDPKTT